MARCGNCKTKLGCSCKMRKASDGKPCCVSCITNYEKALKHKKKLEGGTTNTAPGVILSATATQN